MPSRPRIESSSTSGNATAWPAIGLGDPAPDGADPVVHQQVGSVTGVMSDGFDLDDVAGVHFQDSGCVAVDVTPHAGVGCGYEPVLRLGGSDATGEVEGHVGTLTRRMFLLGFDSVSGRVGGEVRRRR